MRVYVINSENVNGSFLKKIIDAIQSQINEHVAMAWNLNNVSFDIVKTANGLDMKDAGLLYITNGGNTAGAAGIHLFPIEGSSIPPIALVLNNKTLSVNFSHEAIEMLVNPYGMHFKSGPAPNGKGNASYMVEICDPCNLQYYNHKGIDVSDFCFLSYYEKVTGKPLNYNMNISRPFYGVVYGGYVDYQIGKDWYRRMYDGSGMNTNKFNGGKDYFLNKAAYSQLRAKLGDPIA